MILQIEKGTFIRIKLEADASEGVGQGALSCAAGACDDESRVAATEHCRVNSGHATMLERQPVKAQEYEAWPSSVLYDLEAIVEYPGHWDPVRSQTIRPRLGINAGKAGPLGPS